MQIPEPETVQSFVTALAIGALIGVERERRRVGGAKTSLAGIRSFILLSEAGALSMWLARASASSLFFAAALLGVCALVVATRLFERGSDGMPERRGVTTELAAITTFLLGGMAVAGQVALAVGLAVANVALLAFKAPLHGLVRRLGQEDLFAALKLMIASFIVLPLLPDRTVDPWLALNPYKLWLLVVLISALSLVGYVAMRWLGSARGVAVTGLTGGLVSSTAVTLSFARESRAGEAASGGLDDAYAAGILIAWSVMFIRVAGMLLILSIPVLQEAWLPLATMLIIGILASAWFYRRSLAGLPVTRMTDVPLRNPFSLLAACKFACLFAVILLVVALVRRHASGSGVIYVALLAGTTDVDAITLSMADLGHAYGHLPLAAQGVVAATLSNTVAKTALCSVLGSRGLGIRIGLAGGAMLVAGLVALLI